MPTIIQIIEKTPVPDVTVQSALREIESGELAIAMLGFEEDEQEVIYRNMSKRASALLAEEVVSVRDKQPGFIIAEAMESFVQKLKKYARHYEEDEKHSDAHRLRYARNMNSEVDVAPLDQPTIDISSDEALLESFKDLKTFVHAEGAVALEGIENSLDHPVVEKALRLFIDGWDPTTMRHILNQAKESYLNKQRRQLDMFLEGMECLASSEHLLVIVEKLKAYME